MIRVNNIARFDINAELCRLTESPTVNAGIFRFLTFWLKAHICGIDR